MSRLADPNLSVKRAAASMSVLRGSTLTPVVSRALAQLVSLEFPGLRFCDLVGVMDAKINRGQPLTDAVIDDRARHVVGLQLLEGGAA